MDPTCHALVICDAVQTGGGCTNLLGVVTHLEFVEFPTTYGPFMVYAQVSGVTKAASLDVDVQYVASPAHEPVALLRSEHPVEASSGALGDLVSEIDELRIPGPGFYSFALLVGGEPIGECPILVTRKVP
jgi:hypothetical protein